MNHPKSATRGKLIASFALLGLTTACASYEPAPLDPATLIVDLDDERAPLPDAEATSLEDAAGWLRDHGPAVRETLAAWQAAQRSAEVKQPWPNPRIAGGPIQGVGDDVVGSPATGWFLDFSFAIPLGGRLGAQDDLRSARAQSEQINTEAELRDRYLELRRRWADLALARARIDLQDKALALAVRAAQVGSQLGEAGQLGALDVALLDLRARRTETDRIEAELDATQRQAALARLCGVSAERFLQLPEDVLPEMPDELPQRETLRQTLIERSTELQRLRGEYEVAERQLRLEVARQYPDLDLGGIFTGEPGEDRNHYGLTIGLDLPLFDRNQPAIAAARGRRDELRQRFLAAASRQLAELDRSRDSAEIARRRRELLEERVLPRARDNIELAEATLQAGQGNALQVLDVQRSATEVALDVLAAREAEIAAWTDLERVLGRPLLPFPGESRELPALDFTPDEETAR